MDNIGWIKIHRKLLDSDIWTKKPSTWYKVWQYILLKAYHSNTKDLKKGQAFFNFRSEQRAIGVDVTYSVIDHTMRFLKQAKQIATQKTTRGVIITVLNYSLYQKPEDGEKDTESETQSEVKAKSLRNKSDTIYKNVENDKNTLPNGNMVKPSPYGNEEINKILSSYKKHMGFSPTDKSPRHVAHSLRLNILSFIKRNKTKRPDLTFDSVLDKTWSWYMKREELKGESLDVFRRKAKLLFDKSELKLGGETA